jgi:hypothetical protein
MKCAKCGRYIDAEEASKPCPECGSGDRQILVDDAGHGLEMLKLKAKASDGTRLFEIKQGDKLSAHGRKARESLKIDHRDTEKTTKMHIVEEQRDDGIWKVVHNEHEEFPAKRRPKQKAND